MEYFTNKLKGARRQVKKSRRASDFYGLQHAIQHIAKQHAMMMNIEEDLNMSENQSAEESVTVKVKTSFIRTYRNPLFYKPLIICCVINSLIGRVNFSY